MLGSWWVQGLKNNRVMFRDLNWDGLGMLHLWGVEPIGRIEDKKKNKLSAELGQAQLSSSLAKFCVQSPFDHYEWAWW